MTSVKEGQSTMKRDTDPELDRKLSQELAVERPGAPRPPPRRSLARSIAIVATCAAAMVINTMNVSIGISLPEIEKSIDIQEDQLQWLISAYALSSACLLLLFGRLADIHGRKKVFLVGMFWQAVFALGLGFSNSGLVLDILRGLQGMGAAASIPAAMGILAHSFPSSSARSIAFATFAAGAPIGGGLGSVVGGILTQLSREHWRSLFFLSAGLSALSVIGALTSFSPDEVYLEADRRIDWIGAFLVTSALVLIVFVLGQGPIAGWKTPYIIACLVIGVVLMVVFAAWEYHLEHMERSTKSRSLWRPPPLMKLSIWGRSNGRMAVILIIAFLNWCGFMSWIFWVQLYYQNYLGLSPIQTMIRLLPIFVTGCLCNVFVAMVVAKIPLAVLIVTGTLSTASACILFALIDPSTTYWAFGFPSSVLIVWGADFVFSGGTIFVAKIVYEHEQSFVGGLFQTMTQIGTAFGLTISTIVFNNVVNTQSANLGVTVNSAGTNTPMSAKLHGYKAAQWSCAAFPLFAALLGALFLRRVGVVGSERDGSEQTVTEEMAKL